MTSSKTVDWILIVAVLVLCFVVAPTLEARWDTQNPNRTEQFNE